MKKFRGNTGRVYEYLRTHEGISSKEAFEMFGATRLSAIIFCLRRKGFIIENVHKSGKNRFGECVSWDEYKLIGELTGN